LADSEYDFYLWVVVSGTTEHSLYKIGIEPISVEQPCGENVRYLPDFEQLEAELAKQESLSAETVDWKTVADLSAGIIKGTSKDLLVAAYLCNALVITEGYSGLAVGLNILNDMVNNFWDDLFPPLKRLRARQTAISWLAEKAGAHIQANPPAPTDTIVLIEAADMLKQLDNTLVEKMGDQAPLLTDLSSALKNYRRSAQAEASRSEAATADAESSPSMEEPRTAPAAARPKPAAPPETGALETEADSKKALRQIQSSVRDIAAFCISQKLSDARAYRLARVAAWMVIEKTPPDNNGVTQINPPAPERLKFFEVQRDKGDFAALIPELEKTLARSPFWLDGHFEVVNALRALGPEYESAVQTVIRELNCFLRRLPEVPELSFADEMAFAGDQTRLWLNAEVFHADDATNVSGDGDGLGDEPWNLALLEAKQVAAGGDSDEAIALLNAGLANAGALRAQIYWRCALAELLLQIGKAVPACAILESLSQQAESRQMAEWEPQLMSRIYNLLIQSYQKQQKSRKDDKSLKDKAEQAFAQLCWFDPITAISLKGG
jgi:type VI secretion system protein VasJ